MLPRYSRFSNSHSSNRSHGFIATFAAVVGLSDQSREFLIVMFLCFCPSGLGLVPNVGKLPSYNLFFA